MFYDGEPLVEDSGMKKLHLYQMTVLFSVLFSLLGFSYNVWRLEVTEHNSNIRTACFEMLLVLSSLEQLVYAAHYDANEVEGDPRKGWVKVGLVADLSVLTTPTIQQEVGALKQTWSQHWETMAQDKASADGIVMAIDATRTDIKRALNALN